MAYEERHNLCRMLHCEIAHLLLSPLLTTNKIIIITFILSKKVHILQPQNLESLPFTIFRALKIGVMKNVVSK